MELLRKKSFKIKMKITQKYKNMILNDFDKRFLIDFLPQGNQRKKIQTKQSNMKKKVGQVTPEEKNEIQQLFERRNGLNELAKILSADNTELYEKLVKDMGETGTKFQGWWDRMSQKYQWESAENGNWEINFETNEIHLVTQ